MERDASLPSSGFIFDAPGSRRGGVAPYTHVFKFYVGNVIYRVGYQRDFRVLEGQKELLFLSYQTGQDWRAFASSYGAWLPFNRIPYEDDRFCWAAAACFSRFIHTEGVEAFFGVLVDGEPSPIHRSSLRDIDFMSMCGPVWAPIANMLAERHWGVGKSATSRGSKHFAPGAKLYCFPARWGDGYDQIQVVGRGRCGMEARSRKPKRETMLQ